MRIIRFIPASTIAGITAVLSLLAVSQPAFATGNLATTNCSSSTTGFCEGATITTPGNSSTSTTQPPGNGHLGTLPSTTTTYTIPNGCTSAWYNASSALGQALGGATMTATCKGSGAEGNLSYYGTTGHQGNTCTVIGGINGVLVCSVIITYNPGTQPIPPPQSPIPTTQSGIPALDLQAFATINIAAPTIGKLAPSPNPYTYTNYPTQVSVVPSSLPATKTGTASDSSSQTITFYCPTVTTIVNGTVTTRPPSTCSQTRVTTLTANVTATLQGYYWMPEAGTVNGEPNVTTPPGGDAGQTPGSVICDLNQNSISMQNNNNLADPSICLIDFTQPSPKAGFYLRAFGMYAGVGTITETVTQDGAIISQTTTGPTNLGYKFSAPASVQVPVAIIESVNCTTAACVQAGLAPITDNFVPYGPEAP